MSTLSNKSLGTRTIRTVSQAADASIALDPPALGPDTVHVRVTGGAAASGHRRVSDAGDTPSATLATLSADGTTLAFEADVTDAELIYASDHTTTGIG